MDPDKAIERLVEKACNQAQTNHSVIVSASWLSRYALTGSPAAYIRRQLRLLIDEAGVIEVGAIQLRECGQRCDEITHPSRSPHYVAVNMTVLRKAE